MSWDWISSYCIASYMTSIVITAIGYKETNENAYQYEDRTRTLWARALALSIFFGWTGIPLSVAILKSLFRSELFEAAALSDLVPKRLRSGRTEQGDGQLSIVEEKGKVKR